jgi:AcrR family transcriptional regulator
MSAEVSRANPVPVGRAAVVRAVTEAATDLFAERGPAATSIRQIADRAGVNQGLVFRHIGTKNDVVAAVLNGLAQHWADGIPDTPTTRYDPGLRRQLTVIARCILDGYPVGELQRRFPGVQAILGLARAGHPDPRDAAVVTAHALALAMGWHLFEPFLRHSTGLTDLTDSELADLVATQIRRTLQPPD